MDLNRDIQGLQGFRCCSGFFWDFLDESSMCSWSNFGRRYTTVLCCLHLWMMVLWSCPGTWWTITEQLQIFYHKLLQSLSSCLHRPSGSRLGGRGGRLQLRHWPCQTHPIQVWWLLWYLCRWYVTHFWTGFGLLVELLVKILIFLRVQDTRQAILKQGATTLTFDT